jgi:drug/metabolite transporter (DMT)-like permease
VRGAVWFVMAAVTFSIMGALIKLAGQTLSVWEIVLLRTVFALLFVAPAVVRGGPRVLHTQRAGAHLFRALLGTGGMVCFFYAVTHLDLALATTLGFTRTLFVILLALLFLGERIRWRRTVATGVGFLGVIICVQPGAEDFDEWTLSALAFALCGAGVTIMVKRLTRTERPLTIVTYTYLVMGVVSAVPCMLSWRTPTAYELGLVALMGLFSVLGQSCMVRGLNVGEVTAVTPFEYSRLLFAAGIGYLVFAEVPASSTWLGGAVIIASTLYIAIREARLRSRGA